MSDTTEAEQGLPEGETALETPATDDAPETGKEQPETPDDDAPKHKHKPWFQERIDQLTRKNYETLRRAEAAEALADRLSKGGEAKEPATPDTDRLVEQRAAEMTKIADYNAKCDTVYSSGKSDFGDWDATLANFGMLGGLNQPFLEAVTQLPDAHKVLHALGTDMDAAARIMSLPPIPMAMELAKLSTRPAKAKPVSNAPPPITPLDGSGKAGFDPESSSLDEWVKWREAELKKR